MINNSAIDIKLHLTEPQAEKRKRSPFRLIVPHPLSAVLCLISPLQFMSHCAFMLAEILSRAGFVYETHAHKRTEVVKFRAGDGRGNND